MGSTWNDILDAIEEDRRIISIHADDMLRERGIPLWQVVSGAVEGELILERVNARPNPVAEVRQELADGTACKAVWAIMRRSRTARLVTVHFFDR